MVTTSVPAFRAGAATTAPAFAHRSAASDWSVALSIGRQRALLVLADVVQVDHVVARVGVGLEDWTKGSGSGLAGIELACSMCAVVGSSADMYTGMGSSLRRCRRRGKELERGTVGGAVAQGSRLLGRLADVPVELPDVVLGRRKRAPLGAVLAFVRQAGVQSAAHTRMRRLARSYAQKDYRGDCATRQVEYDRKQACEFFGKLPWSGSDSVELSASVSCQQPLTMEAVLPVGRDCDLLELSGPHGNWWELR